MISIICFIIVIFGSLNWLSIGFFQYDLVAGLFGFQGSIFSRIVYIIVGISAIYLTFTVIKHKGRISVKRLKKEEAPIIDKMKSDDESKEQDEQNHNENKNEENQSSSAGNQNNNENNSAGNQNVSNNQSANENNITQNKSNSIDKPNTYIK